MSGFDGKKVALIAAATVLVAFTLPIAVSARPNWQGGISIAGAIPTGDFKDEIEDGGGGICADIVWSPQAQPFGLGVSFEYLIYGDQTRREPLSTTIPDIVVDVTTSNNIVQSHLFFRVG